MVVIPHKIATVSVVVVAAGSSAQYPRGVGDSTSWRRRAVLLFSMLVMLMPLATAIQSGGVETLDTLVDCCSGPHAVVDCSSGIDYKGQRYYCTGPLSPEIRDCLSCIPPEFMEPNTQCSSCCGNATECELEWSWGAVLVTLSVSAVFATCSGVLALTENRRKRKGMSLARAWSIPQGMPMLRATVVDLSDAVLRRTSLCRSDSGGAAGNGGNSDAELPEYVGLLKEMPNDSIYGAFSEQRDADMPVAELADSGVTAVAWHASNSGIIDHDTDSPVNLFFEEGIESSSRTSSASRWRSVRAIARQARRLAAAAAGHREPNPEGAGMDECPHYANEDALHAVEGRDGLDEGQSDPSRVHAPIVVPTRASTALTLPAGDRSW